MPALSFHTLTNCKSSNSFVLIFIQIGGGYPPSELRPTPDSCHPEANRQGSLKGLTASFKLSCSLTSSAFPIYRQRHRTLNGATDSFVETEDGQLITENSK